jgi:O-antigen/teichoic acid export membrane protein
VFVGATIVSGVQDGVAQGFEIFRTLAKLKIVASLLTLLSIYPMAHQFGLDGVLAAVLCGLALKCVILRKAVARSKADAAFPKSGSGVSLREIMVGFAIPSMSVSLGVGFMTWLGTFMLSKQPSGFDQVAIVNAGLQWRGPVLLLALSVGTVAVPAFSRLASQRDDLSASRLRKRLTLANVTAALLVVAVLVPTAEHILNLYGPAFADGYLAFSIIVLSCVPAVVNSVFMHQLVGAGRMWRVFWLHCPHFVVWLVCIVTLVPTYRATGFALSLLIGGTVLTACTVLVELWSARRTPRDHMVLETRTQAKSP